MSSDEYSFYLLVEKTSSWLKDVKLTFLHVNVNEVYLVQGL